VDLDVGPVTCTPWTSSRISCCVVRVELIDDAGTLEAWAQKIATSCGPKIRSGKDKSHAVGDANAMGDPAKCRGVRSGIVMRATA
jgi:hypothetical protein